MASLNTAFKGSQGSLFPKSSFSQEGQHIKERMESFYRDVSFQNEDFWHEASIDMRFLAGDSTLWNELYGAKARHKQQFGFNRIKRVINMISGFQRQNRKSVIVVPVENSDQQAADQFSKLMLWMYQSDGVLETISDSFFGAISSGMNMMQLWMDYSRDPVSGDLRVDRCPYNSIFMDPFFKKKDLSDCNAIWKRSYLTKEQIRGLLPRKADQDTIKDIENNRLNDIYTGEVRSKFNYLPEDWYMVTGKEPQNQLFAYDEFYYRDTRKQKLLRDMETGEVTEWRGDKDSKENLDRFLRTFPQVKLINSQVQTVKMAIVVDGNVVYDGDNPLGTDNYPFIPVFSYFNPELDLYSNRLQSVTRDLRDAQYLYNRRRNIELEMLESQVNSGWLYKENALVDPKSVFMAGEGRGIALKSSAQMTDVQKILPGNVPPSMIQLSELLAKEIQEISGVNEELLGSASDDKAGILSMLRQGAGLTTLQILFDNLDYSMKLLGKATINVVQNKFVPAKVQKIIGEQPSEQFYSKNFGRYDSAVEEGVNTSTQKQMQFTQALHLHEAGIPGMMPTIIDSMTIQNRDKVMQSIEEQQQQTQQAEQAQQQSQQALQAAQAELAQARAIADQGLGAERFSRIPENRAQAIANIAEANKDDEMAVLNKTKALKELEQIDLNQLQTLVNIAQSLRGGEQQQKQQLAQQADTLSQQPLQQQSDIDL